MCLHRAFSVVFKFIASMPGTNCSIYGCGTCRNQKIYSIFKIPVAKDISNASWRSELLKVVTKDHILDANLRILIASDKIYICEKHFGEDDIYNCKFVIKHLFSYNPKCY